MWPPRDIPHKAPSLVIQIEGFSPPPGQIGVVFHGPSGVLATVSVGDWMWQLLQPPGHCPVGTPATVHSHGLYGPVREPFFSIERSPCTEIITSSPVGARTTSGSCANGGTTDSFSLYGPSTESVVETAWTTLEFRR